MLAITTPRLTFGWPSYQAAARFLIMDKREHADKRYGEVCHAGGVGSLMSGLVCVPREQRSSGTCPKSNWLARALGPAVVV